MMMNKRISNHLEEHQETVYKSINNALQAHYINNASSYFTKWKLKIEPVKKLKWNPGENIWEGWQWIYRFPTNPSITAGAFLRDLLLLTLLVLLAVQNRPVDLTQVALNQAGLFTLDSDKHQRTVIMFDVVYFKPIEVTKFNPQCDDGTRNVI